MKKFLGFSLLIISITFLGACSTNAETTESTKQSTTSSEVAKTVDSTSESKDYSSGIKKTVDFAFSALQATSNVNNDKKEIIISLPDSVSEKLKDETFKNEVIKNAESTISSIKTAYQQSYTITFENNGESLFAVGK